MVPVLLLCAAMVRSSPQDAYKEASARVGRDPDAQVRLALWCEANGLDAERARHLNAAVSVAPSHPTARGLQGMVGDRGQWRKPEEIAERARDDAPFQQLLSEYNGRRDSLPNPETAGAHWQLGLWCESHGLQPEAVAHFSNVTRLDPGRADAWKKLGCRLYHGRWVTAAQADAAEAETRAQHEADAYWGLHVRQWWGRWLKLTEDQRETLLAEFGTSLTPRAVPTIHTLFVLGSPEQEAVAIRLLEQIDAPEAARELALLVPNGRTSEIREGAAVSLTRRDPNEAVGPLVDLLRDPLKMRVVSGQGGNVVGMLQVEDENAVYNKIYTQNTIVVPGGGAGMLGLFPTSSSGSRPKTAKAKMQRDEQIVRSTNAARRARDGAIVTALTMVTGENLGSDPGPWRDWWNDVQGVAVDRYGTRPKPTITRYSRSTNIVVTGGHCRCFAAGTLVHTPFGTRPIEALHTGDRVLSTSIDTGELRVEPVVAVYHNLPAKTLQVDLDGETVVSTPIHRFWKVGKGWVMARDLKPGDTIRTVNGLVAVRAVRPDRVQPVFNLEVAEGHSYFVGVHGSLVHDYTLADAVHHAFDASPTLAELTR